ncbi:MAG: hypothetical protein Q9187_007066 [Circinaria calcarea]
MEPTGSSLDGLAPELLNLILTQIPSIQDLHSLVRASSKVYRVFLLSKTRILSSVVHNTYPSDVIPDAITAVNASRLDRGPDKETVIKFINNYAEDRKRNHSEHLLPLSTSIALCKLHRSINYFVQDFTRRSILALQQCVQPSRDIEKLHAPLSTIEKARLQRAFVRFEIYGCLFYARPYFTGTIWSALKQAQIFLTEFPPWEIEELVCVRDYFIYRLADAFDQAEDDFVSATLAEELITTCDDTISGGGNLEKEAHHEEGEHQLDDLGVEDTSDVSDDDELAPDRWSEADRFFSTRSKFGDHDSYAEYMLSLGLHFFRQLFEADGEERRRLLEANTGYSESFLTEALRVPPQQSKFNENERKLLRENTILEFGTDMVNQMNEAWLWSHGYKPSGRWNSHFSNGLRKLGYVFWDSLRLRASGIIGQRYFQPPTQSPEGSVEASTNVS